MAYEFEKLSEVEAIEEFPEEGASVLIEHEGNIKRCPADGLGGGSGSIPFLLASIDPETGEVTLELEDGRTPDEFVASFEKNGVAPTIALKLVQELDEIVEVEYAFLQLMTTSIVPEDATGEYAYLAGAQTYSYDDVVLSNVDEVSMMVKDHFEWIYR